MASFNDYELKLKKKKNHWELENTFHWFIPDFPGRTCICCLQSVQLEIVLHIYISLPALSPAKNNDEMST